MGVVKTRIIKIGNSQGLCIPQLFLEQLNLREEVGLEVQENRLIICPLQPPRYNWEQSFQSMAANYDDQLLDKVVPCLTTWDEEEWEW